MKRYRLHDDTSPAGKSTREKVEDKNRTKHKAHGAAVSETAKTRGTKVWMRSKFNR